MVPCGVMKHTGWVLAGLLFTAIASAQAPKPAGHAEPDKPRAIKVDAQGNLAPAPAAELSQPHCFRQILILPAGYTAAERDLFVQDAQAMVRQMGNLPEAVYTRQYRDRLIYLIHYLPGQSLASGRASLGARLYAHPVRGGTGITLRNEKVIEAVQALQRRMPTLDPIGVITIFNHNGQATANAVPPMFLNRPYGIARLTRRDIHETRPYAGRTWSQYVAAHELAHAALNFLDEYIEPTLAGLHIARLDALMPLLRCDGTWRGWRDAWKLFTGAYDMRLSEILADNGSEHISTRPIPSRVATPGFAPLPFAQEGGMMFSRGTFHATGNNIMNSNWPLKSEGNRFGWGHSLPQMQVLEQVFNSSKGAPRPNDRIRPAGPMHAWWPQWGPAVRLLLFDADKNHRWHPTTQYQIELRWQEPSGWKSQTHRVTPQRMVLDLRNTLALTWASRLRNTLLAVGVRQLPGGSGRPFNLAAMSVEEMLQDLLPTTQWPLPYQQVQLPLPLAFHRYHWRFRTHNGSHWSGWTHWSTFCRGI